MTGARRENPRLGTIQLEHLGSREAPGYGGLLSNPRSALVVSGIVEW